jgi:DNA-binding FadR family transcriptional regulator
LLIMLRIPAHAAHEASSPLSSARIAPPIARLKKDSNESRCSYYIDKVVAPELNRVGFCGAYETMETLIDRSTIHHHLVGDLHRPKSALSAAQKIESMIARQGWVVGARVGSEQTLRKQFGLGHRVGRETIRVLQSRDAIHARRGSHGGLTVGDPPRSMAISAIAEYLEAIAVTDQELAEALAVLGKTAGRKVGLTANHCSDVFTAAIAEIQRYAQRDQADAPHTIIDDVHPGTKLRGNSMPNSSARVALRLQAEIERLRRDDKPPNLGSEHELCERYGVGRPILLQALRILEARGVIESRRGRFGGIDGRVLSVRGAIEAALSYLSTVHLDRFDALRWTNSLDEALNTFAVERWSDENQRRTEALLSPSNALHANWQLWLTLVQWDACGNRVLAFVARCNAAYLMRFVPDGHHISARDLRDYQASLLERSRAISRRDLRGAREALQYQNEVLERGLEFLLNRAVCA